MLNPQFREYLKSVSWNETFFGKEGRDGQESWLDQEDILTKKFYPNASGGLTLQNLQDAFLAGTAVSSEGGNALAEFKLNELQPVISEMNGWANFRHWVLEGHKQDAVDFVELHNEYNKAMTLVIELKGKVAQLTDVVQNRVNEYAKQMVTETIQQKVFFAEQAMTHLRRVVTGDAESLKQAKAWLSQFKPTV